MRYQTVTRVIAFAIAYLMPTLVEAQVTNGGTSQIGPSYAGRASDSGTTSGIVNSSGGYEVSIPFDLPPTRDGTPVPFGVNYGGRRAGAAGLGWDIPLTYIFQDTTIAHRKPANRPDLAPTPMVPIEMSFNGETIDILENGSTGNYRARKNHPLLQALHPTSNTWTVNDGDGRQYNFSSHGGVPNLWLLDSIENSYGFVVTVSYAVGTNAGGVSLDLTSITYDFDSSGNCAKYEVDIGYNSDAASPISANVMGGSILERYHTINKVSVSGRPQCGSSLTSLREYDFSYQADSDTQLPQLASVAVRGRQNTAEYNTPQPIATYHYGTASTASSCATGECALEYSTYQVALPVGPDGNYTAKSDSSSTSLLSGTSDTLDLGTQELIDINGDGLPDLIYSTGSGLAVAPGDLTSTGPSFEPPTGLGDSSVQVTDNTFGMYLPYSDTDTPELRHRVDVYRKVIDINGDGRLDIISAVETPGYWTIYLNTPSEGSSGVNWQVRYVPTAQISQTLSALGHDVDPWGVVPLERDYAGYYEYSTDGSDCSSGTWSVPNNIISALELEQATYTEWTLQDINGDGYPDFVFNTNPVNSYNTGENYGANRVCATGPVGYAPSPANDVDVFYDVAGIALTGEPANAIDIFSSPVTISDESGAWDGGVGYAAIGLSLGAGLMDINGDGIPDRVSTTEITEDGVPEPGPIDAYLGVAGLGSAFWQTPITFPSSYGVQIFGKETTAVTEVCTAEQNNSGLEYSVLWSGGLRDVTGDGIPDLITSYGIGDTSHPAVPSVYPGTGAGFSTSPLSIESSEYPLAATPDNLSGMDNILMSPGLPVSSNENGCADSYTRVNAGLYDLDGDGFRRWSSVQTIISTT